jgi:hypothetical protein
MTIAKSVKIYSLYLINSIENYLIFEPKPSVLKLIPKAKFQEFLFF